MALAKPDGRIGYLVVAEADIGIGGKALPESASQVRGFDSVCGYQL